MNFKWHHLGQVVWWASLLGGAYWLSLPTSHVGIDSEQESLALWESLTRRTTEAWQAQDYQASLSYLDAAIAVGNHQGESRTTLLESRRPLIAERAERERQEELWSYEEGLPHPSGTMRKSRTHGRWLTETFETPPPLDAPRVQIDIESVLPRRSETLYMMLPELASTCFESHPWLSLSREGQPGRRFRWEPLNGNPGWWQVTNTEGVMDLAKGHLTRWSCENGMAWEIDMRGYRPLVR